MRKYNKKNNAYRGVLKNKNLAGILEAGFNAPVGSTKRKHAQKVFSILKKMQNDGKGGPGPSIPRVNMQLQPRVVDYSQMMVLPPTPPVRVPIGKKAPASYPMYDGKGAAPIGGMTLNLAGSTPSTAGSLVIPKYVPSFTSRLLGSPLTKAIGSNPATAGAVMFGPGFIEDAYMSSQDRVWETNAEPWAATANSTPQTRTYLPKGTTATGMREEAAAAEANKPVVWGLPGSTPKTGTTGPVTLNTSNVPGQSTQTPATSNPYEGMNLQNLSAMLAGGSANPTSNPSTQFPNLVQNAVDQNIGPTLFAYQAMQKGADYLKQLPGMSDLPASALEGGSLSERLKSMDASLRKSYGLDELLNNYADLVKNGGSIQGQMTDYIRGRDEFLNETEGLISDLKRTSMKADMSDPRTQANMQNHMNYLYEMRGRQNKRYVEFLKMSVDEYSARTTAAENLYKMRYDEYARELEYNTNMTTEQYNMMFSGIQELYTTVANAPLFNAQVEQAQAELLATYAKMAGDTSEYNAWTTGNYSDLYKTFSDTNLIDKDGRWTNSINAVYAGQDVKAFIPVMQDAVLKAVTLPDSEGKYPDQRKIQSTIGNALGHIALLLEGGYITSDTYNNAESKLRSIAFQALNTNGIVSDDNIGTYREAIDALDGKVRWGPLPNVKPPTREEFIAKYSNLNKDILSNLFDQMQYYLSEDSSRKASDWVQMKLTARGDLAQGGTPLSDEDLKNNLINNYVNSFQAQSISAAPGFGQTSSAATSGTGTRAQRNNNPLNIKMGGYTANAPGITGIDQIAASDGGNFLIFNSPEAGFNAAKMLLKSDLYSTLTVDQALRKWSGSGYGGTIVPSYSHRIVNSLTDSELDYILNRMATAEGYYA